jgi:hypothetical protein
MTDQPKTDQDATLAALRERAAELAALRDAIERNKLVAEARLAEINTTIEIVARAGKKKPGPKPGGREMVIAPDPVPTEAEADLPV